MRSRSILVFAAGLLLWVPQAVGQTRFTWPDTAATVSKYSIEACKSALRRVKRDLIIRRLRTNKVWWDTMPVSPLDSDTEPVTQGGTISWGDDTFDAWLPIPLPGAVAVAQHCGGGRFTGASAPVVGDSIPISKETPLAQPLSSSIPNFTQFFRSYQLFDLYFLLFREAGSDADLRTYLDRYLQGAPSDTVAKRLVAALRDLGFNRRWYPLAEEFVTKYAPRIADRVTRARFYAYLVPSFWQREQWHIDTVTSLRAVARVERFIDDSLTDAERKALTPIVLNGAGNQITDILYLPTASGWCGQCTGGTLDGWVRELTREIRLGRLAHSLARGLDSLRKSTDAYFAFWRTPTEGGSSHWEKTDSGKDSMLVWNSLAEYGGIGGKATPIQATAWAGSPVNGPRPTPGKISLVVFFAGSSYCAASGSPDSPDEFRGNCAQYLIPLRRVVDQFPNLEVTVLARTYGHFQNIVDSMTPAKEAELTYQALAGFGIKRVPVAMYDMPFIRLPEPDGRIMQRTADDINTATYGGVASHHMVTSTTPSFSVGEMMHGDALLIDEKGTIVYQTDLSDRTRHDELNQFIRTLFERNHLSP